MKKIISIFLVIFITFTVSFFQTNSSYGATKKVKVTSSDFNNKGFIPDVNACEFLGSDKSPQLSFSNAPSGTKSFALIMFDPDAPGNSFVHWVVFNIPVDFPVLEQDISRDTATLENGTKQGTNGTGQIGYLGPCPPPGETHRYVFNVFALDTVLDLESSATKKQLTQAMRNHILGKGKIIGLYKNNTNN